MRFEAQINELSKLNWDLKREIDRLQALKKMTPISKSYKAHLESNIESKKQVMLDTEKCIDIILKHDA